MTLEEYKDIKKRLDSGELDYDTLTPEQRRECRRFKMEAVKEEVIQTAQILAKHNLPTGMEMITRDKSRPVYEAASRTKIVYDKNDPVATKNAKKLKKKREKAIKVTGTKFMKKRKKIEKEAKKKAKKYRKKLEKKSFKKLKKKAYKIYKKLSKKDKRKYDIYAMDKSPKAAIRKIVDDWKEEKIKQKQLALWWGAWMSGHVYDQNNPEDVALLEHVMFDSADESPQERFRQRVIASGRPDPERVFGKYATPRVRLEEEDINFYLDKISIRSHDWDEYEKYVSKKKFKKLTDIIKYRRKFNWKKLDQNDQAVDKKHKKNLASYMYIPAASRDTEAALKEYERVAKSGKMLKGVTRDFADFIRQHNPNLPQHIHDNLEKFIEERNKTVDKMVKEAKKAIEYAEYESMRDDSNDPKWEPRDLDCTPIGNLDSIFK